MRPVFTAAVTAVFAAMSTSASASGQRQADAGPQQIVLASDQGRHPFPADASDFIQKDGELNLASLLAVQQGVSMFYDYLRSISHVNERTMVALQKTTLFAPSNPTIIHLARKPHQGPTPNDAPSLSSDKDKEKENFAYLDRWVSSHAVESMITPDQLGNSTKEAKNMDGKGLKIECPGKQDGDAVKTNNGEEAWKGCKVDGADIIAFAAASNGIVYTIDGTIPVKDDE